MASSYATRCICRICVRKVCKRTGLVAWWRWVNGSDRLDRSTPTFGENHGHFTVLIELLSDGGYKGYAFLLRFEARWCSVVGLLHDLGERLELIRVAINILNSDASFLAASKIVCTEGNVLSRWSTPCSQRRLSWFAWHTRPRRRSRCPTTSVNKQTR